MVTANDRKVEQDYGIAADVFRRAEPGKELGGVDPDELRSVALASGFSSCTITFDWFLGQGAVMHGQSFEDAAVIEAYLRRTAPVTNHMFKYLFIQATR